MSHYIRHVYIRHPGSIFIVLSLLSTMLLLLTACSGASTPTSSTRNNGATTTATKQILKFPNVGASDVTSGKATILRGLKAIDDHTLQITLTQPSDYFLKALTNPLFFPLNQKVIEQYGQKKWIQYVANNGAGTGPFQLKEWDHNIKMVFTPNPHYYGNKTKLKEVDMIFVNDPATAYTTYRAGQYDFVWGLTPDDQVAAKGSAGFTRMPLLQTDLLFFDNTQ